MLPVTEALYGGAAGGGKSDALLMDALQYVDVPGYSAILFRRTFADLALPGALMDRAHDWLGPTAARWNERDKTWTFPSGATLSFGYLETDKHRYRYQGSEYQHVGFDELTQFSRKQYTYLFSRLRRLEGVDIPIRMRAGSNPGGEGHEWVYERFIAAGPQSGRMFVPAKLADNPHLDQEEYERSLMELDPIERQQLLEGLWVTDPHERSFRRDWWRGQNRYDPDDSQWRASAVARIQSWDTGIKDKDNSAYTAVAVGEFTRDYRLVLREVWREKLIFPDLTEYIDQFARRYNRDGKLRGVLIEDKASGTSAYQTLTSASPDYGNMLVPFAPSGSKEQRAQQASVWCKLGCVLLPTPSESTPWLHDFENELFAFPGSEYADQVDAFTQLILYMEPYIREGYYLRQGQGIEHAAD